MIQKTIEHIKLFFKPTKSKIIISSILFIIFIFMFYLFSSILLNNCKNNNISSIDRCADIQAQYKGDGFASVIRISYYFTMLSIPSLYILSELKLNSPFIMWMIAILSNLIYVYILGCSINFVYHWVKYENVFSTNNPVKIKPIRKLTKIKSKQKTKKNTKKIVKK